MKAEKECFTCKSIKPIKEFYSNKAKPTGVYGSCIPCVKSKLVYPKSKDLQILYLPNLLFVEEWASVIINGITSPYLVSDCGRVRLPNGNIGKPSFDQREYPQIILTVNKKRFGRRIHVLVANAFLVNQEKLREINHKDGNKLFPYRHNLEYVSSKDNIRHAIDNGLRVHYSPHSHI